MQLSKISECNGFNFRKKTIKNDLNELKIGNIEYMLATGSSNETHEKKQGVKREVGQTPILANVNKNKWPEFMSDIYSFLVIAVTSTTIKIDKTIYAFFN